MPDMKVYVIKIDFRFDVNQKKAFASFKENQTVDFAEGPWSLQNTLFFIVRC